MLTCFGRFSGTDDGYMLFENQNGDQWEEKSREWELIIVLTYGFSYYRNKYTGLIAYPAT